MVQLCQVKCAFLLGVLMPQLGGRHCVTWAFPHVGCQILTHGQGYAKLSHVVHRRRQGLSRRAAAQDKTQQFNVDRLEFQINNWLTKCPNELLSVSS